MCMKLSIIVPVFNVERYIAYCLDSLVNQDIPDNEYEIIIVNDGSSDSSPKIAEEYVQRFSNVILYSQENSGVGAARNKGVEISKGKYVYFIDPDDYIVDNSLATLLNNAETKNLDVLGFKSINTTNTNLKTTSTKNENTTVSVYNDGISYIAKNEFKNAVWWYFIKSDFLIKSGLKFIEGRWMEDAIFTASLLLSANNIGFADYDVHRHVQIPNSAMTNKEPEHYIKVIYDNENAAMVYDELINKVNLKHAKADRCIHKLRKKQESFVFFLLIRALRSELSFAKTKVIIARMKTIKAYPLKLSFGRNFSKFNYMLITPILNNKLLLFLSFKIFRFFK